MADEKLTQQPIATSAADNDLFYIVRVSDGLSMRITKDNFLSNYLKGNQTITLSGDVTGSGTTSITVTVQDNSHNHTIANVTGLQAQLNLKANLTAITKALIDALGVNATTLDGIDSLGFLQNRLPQVSGDLNLITIDGKHPITVGATNIPPGAGALGSILLHFNWDNNAAKQVYLEYNSNRIFTRRKLDTWQPWVETASNALQFLRSDVADTMDATLTIAENIRLRLGTQFEMFGNGNESYFDLRTGNLIIRDDGFATRFTFGRTTGNFTATGTIQSPLFLEVSDERLKNKIVPISKSIRTFELKSNKGKKRYGVIAQELEKTNPELVHTNDDGFKSVNYIDFLCMKSAEQENEIEQLKILVKQLIDKG